MSKHHSMKSARKANQRIKIQNKTLLESIYQSINRAKDWDISLRGADGEMGGRGGSWRFGGCLPRSWRIYPRVDTRQSLAIWWELIFHDGISRALSLGAWDLYFGNYSGIWMVYSRVKVNEKGKSVGNILKSRFDIVRKGRLLCTRSRETNQIQPYAAGGKNSLMSQVSCLKFTSTTIYLDQIWDVLEKGQEKGTNNKRVY